MMFRVIDDRKALARQSFRVFWSITLLLVQTGCRKLATVSSPETELTSGNVYSNDETAASVLTGLYTQLNTNSPSYGQSVNSISLVCGLSADELSLFGGSANANATLVPFYLNQLVSGSANSSTPGIWSDCFTKLYTINIALQRLTASTGLTLAVKQQLTGEAKFLRAFIFFYLVNLYGNTPLVVTSDYEVNATLSRSSQALVYQQIVSDLKDAQGLLSDGYVAADAMSQTTERVRPNKWAATALLARAYLYNGIYDSAETQASAVINNANYRLCSLDSVFLKNSSETIWQWQPVNAGWNTEDARIFILPATGPSSSGGAGTGYPVTLSPQLLSSFEPGDSRRLDWVDSATVDGVSYYYPYKYKSAMPGASVTEYQMVLRLGEQYLIQAEARAQQNTNIQGAADDLNTIRMRAGLANTGASDRPSLLIAILHERQVELFTEWGHRWLDLKRSGTLDVVMNSVVIEKGTSWNSDWQWYPIPLYDITQNSNLEQNAGY